MATLNETQVDWLVERLIRDSIATESLQEDLIDHFCCYIEEKMAIGHTFEESYALALQAIAPDGLKEIEEAFLSIHNYKPFISMVRILYFSSFLATFLHILYFLFKHLYWPGAHALLQAGFTVILVLVLPSLGMLTYKHRQNLSTLDTRRMIIGMLAGGCISLGMLLKGLHFPGGSILFALGCVLLAFVFLPLFLYQLYKKSIAG